MQLLRSINVIESTMIVFKVVDYEVLSSSVVLGQDVQRRRFHLLVPMSAFCFSRSIVDMP